jgi:hypothetical protein
VDVVHRPLQRAQFVTTSDNPSVTWSVSTGATVQGNFIRAPE